MTTRPYFIIYEGKPRMVEASSPAGAVHHVVGAAITDIRPARGAEVSAWLRGGKEIEIAGQKPADNSQGTLVVEDGGFNANDARQWITDNLDGEEYLERVLDAFDSARESGRMTAQDFDAFHSELTDCIFSEGPQIEPYSRDGMMAYLEQLPMPFDKLVHLIGEQKRRDLFEDVVEATVEHGTNGTKVAK